MALTNEERFQRERDQALALIGELAALRSNPDAPDYPQNMQPVLDKLDEFDGNAEFQDNIDAASQAKTAALDDVMEDALQELSDIAKEMNPLGAQMAEARDVAARGERELTLPRIAAVSATTLSSLESLLKSIQGLNAADLLESTATIKVTIGKLKELIAKLPSS